MPNTLLADTDFLARVVYPLLEGMRADFARDPDGFRAWWVAQEQQAAAMGDTMLLPLAERPEHKEHESSS